MSMKRSIHVQSKADDSSETFPIYIEYSMREINSELFKYNYFISMAESENSHQQALQANGYLLPLFLDCKCNNSLINNFHKYAKSSAASGTGRNAHGDLRWREQVRRREKIEDIKGQRSRWTRKASRWTACFPESRSAVQVCLDILNLLSAWVC